MPSTRYRRIQVADLTFRVAETPHPSRATVPTIVLVHGIGMSHRYLSRLHGELVKHARVISVDLPGFGGLPKPSRPLGIARMSFHLGEALDLFGEAPFVLVGHSMGVQWVIELAAQRPDSVASVVAIGPVVDARHRSMRRQALALGLDTLVETPAINAIVFSDYLRCGVPWYLHQLRHMLTYRTEQRIGDIDAPVLLIRGAGDPVAGREWCRLLRDRARDARLVEIPHHHHVVQHSAPRAVASAILSHLRHVSASDRIHRPGGHAGGAG